MALWSNLVMPLELKARLSSTPDYHAAISQVFNRAWTMFDEQPERLSVVTGVADAGLIEFWRFDKVSKQDKFPYRALRTGLQQLDTTANSEGYVRCVAECRILTWEWGR